MNLDFDADELAFRDEARAWLAANVPAEPLPSMDTAEGFAAHREWERAARRRAAVGGLLARRVRRPRTRRCCEWVIFEEEYYRAGAPGRVEPERHLPARADAVRRTAPPSSSDRLPAADGAGPTTVWAQAWSEPEAGSDLASLRSHRHGASTAAGC